MNTRCACKAVQQLCIPDCCSLKHKTVLRFSPAIMRSAVARPTVSTTFSAWLGIWASSRVRSSASASLVTWTHLKEGWTPCCKLLSARWMGPSVLCLHDTEKGFCSGTMGELWLSIERYLCNSIKQKTSVWKYGTQTVTDAYTGAESRHVRGHEATSFQGNIMVVIKARNRFSIRS